jgi:hypothetical protein
MYKRLLLQLRVTPVFPSSWCCPAPPAIGLESPLCLSTFVLLTWSVAGHSPRRHWFNPRSVHVRFMVDKLALGQVLYKVLQFSHTITIPPMLHTRSLISHRWYITSVTDSVFK